MRIALIAHDKKKADMIALAGKYRALLARHELYATGTTGKLITESTGLPVTRMQSGPIGGDQQIGAMGSVLSEHQIWGEKHSIPRSKRLPPEEQLSSRMSGRGAKMRRSTSYSPRIYSCPRPFLNIVEIFYLVPSALSMNR